MSASRVDLVPKIKCAALSQSAVKKLKERSRFPFREHSEHCGRTVSSAKKPSRLRTQEGQRPLEDSLFRFSRKALIYSVQRIEKFRRRILGNNRVVLSLASRFEDPVTDVLQDSGNCFRDGVEKTFRFEDILGDPDARAQYLGPAKNRPPEWNAARPPSGSRSNTGQADCRAG